MRNLIIQGGSRQTEQWLSFSGMLALNSRTPGPHGPEYSETGLPYIDPETGLPYLEETEELSEEDMEIAAYVWSHPDEIDEAIEQARKTQSSKEKKSAVAQENESD